LTAIAPRFWRSEQGAGSKTQAIKKVEKQTRPKLVVLLVVDQMRGDYVDKFRGQWSGGLKRLLTEVHGSGQRPSYAATKRARDIHDSTGSFPANHGMVANAWWDRGSRRW